LDSFSFYDQCASVAGWAADLAAKGEAPARGDTLGTYMTTMGPTTPYTPNASDETMLVTQLSQALSGVRSCTFDLSTFKIDTTKLSEAEVYLVDSASSRDDIPLDPNSVNGWNMTSATELQLYGSWCDKLRAPTTTDIKFNFPCDIVICIDNCT
jgi:hypothetical protein